MAENEGKTRGSALAAVQSAQSAIGSVLTKGAPAGVSGGFSDNTPILGDIHDTLQENVRNTTTFVDVLKQMFRFDKEAFARARDQRREVEKESDDSYLARGVSPMSDLQMPEIDRRGLAAVGALALFMKDLGANMDLLKLPTQLKNIKSMGTFVKGVAGLATLGLFSADNIKDAKLAVKTWGSGIITKLDDFFKPANTAVDDAAKRLKNVKVLGLTDDVIKNWKLANDDWAKQFGKVGDKIKGVATTFKESKFLQNIKNFFTGQGGLFASAKLGGPIAQFVDKLKALGKTIAKWFWPITLVLAIFDGYQGFMKEYEDTGSIVDGLRGMVVGVVDGFIGSFVRLITDLLGEFLIWLGLDKLGSYVKEFGENITADFNRIVGGLVDFVTGIFTLDMERIWKGLKNVTGGALGFFSRIVTLPIDMAVNFVQDIFGWGDPDKPFSLMDFFLGDDGPVMSAWNWFKDLFTFDFNAIKQKVFDMGAILGGLSAGGIAAAKAILPGGESPGEAFKRVFDSWVKGSKAEAEPSGETGVEKIAKASTTDVKGNVTETVFKTETIKEGGATTNNAPVIINQGTNSAVSTQNNNQSNIYTPDMNTSVDAYHDRSSWSVWSPSTWW